MQHVCNEIVQLTQNIVSVCVFVCNCAQAWGCNATSFDTLNADDLNNLPPAGQSKFYEDSDNWLGVAARQYV